MMALRETGEVALVVAKSDGFWNAGAFFEGERMQCRQKPLAVITIIGFESVKG